MAKINVLPFAVANLIAAGEVVDRPASVIKELMENALDAGADRITVEIQNGGVTLMRVTDNGCGISPEDLPVAIRRHATSKIRNAEDLDSILTLGFRGEALAAIAAVSHLRIISKTADAELGAVLESDGGNLLSIREQGCATGTSVIVEDLFANVPARRKFLKKDVTESMAVVANVEKIALSHPEISMRLIVDGNIRLETAGDGNLHNTVYAVFGKEFATRLIPVNSDNDGIRIHGFIGRSDNFKANRNHENFFINGRYVKSKTAMAALEQAYTSYMPPEKFPACVLFLEISPNRVDVNVHPAKLEVKFSGEKPIFEAIYYTVRSALENNHSRPEFRLTPERKSAAPTPRMSEVTQPIEEGRKESLKSRQLSYDLSERTQPQPQERMRAEEFREKYAKAPTLVDRSLPYSVNNRESQPRVTLSAPVAETVDKTVEKPIQPTKTLPTPEATPSSVTVPSPKAAPPQADATKVDAHPLAPPPPQRSSEPPKTEPVRTEEAPPVETARALPEYRIVGEIFLSYIIVETDERMLLIDKHAAHERILFEQLKAALHSAEPSSQMLMLPIEVMMTQSEVEILKQFNEELDRIGFSLRFARNTVSVDAHPERIRSDAVGDVLQSMAARLLDTTGDVTLTRDILLEKALYQAACKAAIKAGREYEKGHIEWLVKQLMLLPDITFCPHGRPVAMEISKKSLDRQFDRMGF